MAAASSFATGEAEVGCPLNTATSIIGIEIIATETNFTIFTFMVRSHFQFEIRALNPL
jgi:hypothetical protein